jgi:polyribonucleotide nucleotidyltransferase
LIYRDGKYVSLTDILGAEDALGDMDFKVAGTSEVITALQLDTKLVGLPADVLTTALDQARVARLFILDKMNAVISEPRAEMNEFAPRIESIEIPKDKIGEVIGPKGAVIRELEELTGAKLEIEETDGKGIVRIASNDGSVLAAAKERVMQIAFPPEVELGSEYEGKVVNITKFGAFVNLLPGRDGLLHISRLDGSKRVERVEDYLTDGQVLKVRVREIDRGKVSLELVDPLEGATLPGPEAPRQDSGDRGGRDRDRGGDRGGRDRDRGDRGGRGGRDRERGDRGGRDRARGDSDRTAAASEAPKTETGDRRRAAQSFDEVFEEISEK